MASLREEIEEGLRNGSFRNRLLDYCLDWRSNRSRYAVGNLVAMLAAASQSDKLFESLLDPDFRRRRRAAFGVTALRTDIHAGLSYYSRKRFDVLRYLQILFLEPNTTTPNAAAVQAHQRHCREFADFLQLDTHPSHRANQGVHRLLGKVFPMVLKASRADLDDPPAATVALRSYELGTWRCQCGSQAGQLARFDYSCSCEAVRGNGMLKRQLLCRACSGRVSYVTCPACGTRVTLDLFWQIRQGQIDPSRYQVPLTLHLGVSHLDGRTEELTVVPLHLPLLLGIRERGHQILFELPDVLWLDGPGGDWGNSSTDRGVFVAFGDTLRYDRQTEVGRIFESVLRRTLFGSRGGGSLRKRLTRHVLDRKGDLAKLTGAFDRALRNRLRYGLASADGSPTDPAQLIDLSVECAVAASPQLRGNMAYVNRRLIAPEAFTAQTLKSYVAVLEATKLGEDTLSQQPPGCPSRPTLDIDGILPPGSTVVSGEILIGLTTPRTRADLTQEEKLLHAIFGHAVEDVKDNSLYYTGAAQGQVISVHIVCSPRWANPLFTERPGKSIRPARAGELAPGELARIAVTVGVEIPLGVGDSLFAEDGASVVVCQILGGAALTKIAGTPIEPDVVVAPSHPFAQPDHASQVWQIRLGLRGGGMLPEMVRARATGPYSLTTQQPLVGGEYTAERLASEDFDWLLACGCMRLASELYGPHSDCVEWRTTLYEAAAKGHGLVAALKPTLTTATLSLLDCPPETLRTWCCLLRAAGITTAVAADPPALSFRLVDDAEVLSASFGEVKKPETLDFHTYRPEKDGLFCERIFGPEKDWECACGKYRGMKYKDEICDRCGVKVTHSRVRRKRMGHIELAAPVVHPWYFRREPNILSMLLGLPADDLESVIYYRKHVVIEAGSAPLLPNQMLTDEEYSSAVTEYRDRGLRVETGAAAIASLLAADGACPPRPENAHALAWAGPGRRARKWAGALPGIIQGGGEALGRLVLRRLTVLPPDLRPLVLLANGSVATSDLNDLYRRVINRNNRLRKLIELNAPAVIIQNERRQLQEEVDHLFDNEKSHKPASGMFHRPLLSLAGFIANTANRGKPLLDSLLLRGLDYSARTLLAVNNTDSIDSGRVPAQIAYELFQPLLIGRLKATGVADTFKSARRCIERDDEEVRAAFTAIANELVLLVSTTSAPWRLFALHPQLGPDLTLTVHPDLLDLIGWDALGKEVRLFGVLGEESIRDADRLLPTRLRYRAQPNSVPLGETKRSSPFMMTRERMPAELAYRALTGGQFPLGIYDFLLMGTAEAFAESASTNGSSVGS